MKASHPICSASLRTHDIRSRRHSYVVLAVLLFWIVTHHRLLIRSGTIIEPDLEHLPASFWIDFFLPSTFALPLMENSTLLDNQEVLATRWLSTRQLEEAGIPCRRGPFIERETQNIDEAIKRYQMEHKLNDEQVDDLVFSDVTNGSANGFWSYVARSVPQRGVKSIYYYVRRARDSLGKAGKWNPAEDKQLQRAVQEHGTAWVVVSDLLYRSPADCSDRYHHHIRYQGTKRSRGAWSREEESQLLCVIEELAKAGKTDMSARGFWVSASKAFGGTRTPKQCRNKWTDTLQGKIGNEVKARWGNTDSYILVCKIASLDLDEETDIDWKSLKDASWNRWSSHSLKQRWKSLKASINNDGMSHREVIHNLMVQTRSYFTPNTSAPSLSMSYT
ncbi:hypothetical protein BGY98DRAFT_547795 [Russula aff. rugulosa BPL654]|nr:hypothetical protein BGY98DRAFT_547795 [Russula aff. rugulosa BPL654]